MKDLRRLRHPRESSPHQQNRCVSKTTVFESARSRPSPGPQIIGYARVSTRGQKHRMQIDALKAAGCTRIIKEVASGADWDRPLFRAILKELRAGDTLMVWRIDRWARDLLLLLLTTKEIDERGADFKSVTEGFDFRTANGKFVMQMLGGCAEQEYNANKIRTEAGLRAARTAGKRSGRRPAISQDTLLAAIKMLKGSTVKAVAQHFGVAPSTLYRHLRSPDL